MDDEMIERCAKACFEKLCPGIRYTEADKSFYKEAQIAAIKSMREPTNYMRNKYFELSHKTEVFYDAHWERAIDGITND